jgi:hypothetical protein
MNSDSLSGVKEARLLVDAAIQSALGRGIVENQLMHEVDVRTAYEHLTATQAAEHLRRLRERHKDSSETIAS